MKTNWYQEEYVFDDMPKGMHVYIVGDYEDSETHYVVTISTELYDENTDCYESAVFYTNKRKKPKLSNYFDSSDLYNNYQNAIDKIRKRFTKWSEFQTIFEIERMK